MPPRAALAQGRACATKATKARREEICALTQTPIAQAVLTKAVHLNVYPAQLGNRVRARGRRQRLLASCAQQAHSGTLQAPQPAPCVRLGRPTTSLGLTRPSIALNARLERTRQGLAPRPVSNVLPASTDSIQQHCSASIATLTATLPWEALRSCSASATQASQERTALVVELVGRGHINLSTVLQCVSCVLRVSMRQRLRLPQPAETVQLTRTRRPRALRCLTALAMRGTLDQTVSLAPVASRASIKQSRDPCLAKCVLRAPFKTGQARANVLEIVPRILSRHQAAISRLNAYATSATLGPTEDIARRVRKGTSRKATGRQHAQHASLASTAQSSALASRLCACLAPRRLPLAPAAPACTTVRVTQDMQGSWAGLAQHVRQGFTNQEWASKIALSASLAHTVIQTLRRLITTSKASRLCACGRSSRARRAALRVLRIASP
jgi:hypothetical protein